MESNTPKLSTAYFKAFRVIRSCNTLDQLDAANRYVNNFFKLYSFKAKDKNLFFTNSELETAYTSLLQDLNKRRNFLSNE